MLEEDLTKLVSVATVEKQELALVVLVISVELNWFQKLITEDGVVESVLQGESVVLDLRVEHTALFSADALGIITVPTVIDLLNLFLDLGEVRLLETESFKAKVEFSWLEEVGEESIITEVRVGKLDHPFVLLDQWEPLEVDFTT